MHLDSTWTALMHAYEAQHEDARNRRCHRIGIPLIAASLPIGATVVGLPLAIPMLAVGCAFQGIGHLFEGKNPAFVDDPRNVLVGLLWWLRESGAPIRLSDEPSSERSSVRHVYWPPERLTK
jgi:uncharacterized membrane protein YGL010W